MGKGTQCNWGLTNRTNRLGDSIKSAPAKPPVHMTSVNGTRNTRSPKAMSGSPTTSQPTMKTRLPQIVQAETVPGPLMNAQKTKPETSQVAPKLFKDAAKRALRLVTEFSINKESDRLLRHPPRLKIAAKPSALASPSQSIYWCGRYCTNWEFLVSPSRSAG